LLSSLRVTIALSFRTRSEGAASLGRRISCGGRADVSNEAVLRLEWLTKRFGDRTALRDISLSVNQSEYVALLGPSGSGKSTLLRAIAGFDPPDSGRVFLLGEDVTRRPAHRRDIGFVFQNFALFPHLNVVDNVAFGLRNRAEPMPEAQISERVAATIDLVGLRGLERRGVNQISGGQKQRVALARTLVIRPKLVLLDEPLGALDANLRDRMRSELRRIREQLGIPFLHVTGSESEALAMGDRMIVLDSGKIGQFGTPNEVYNTPANANVARFLNRYNVFSGALDDDGFVSKYGRFGYGLKTASPEAAYAIRYDRVGVSALGAGSGAKMSAQYVATEYLGSALVHFFEAEDGKVVEVEHHLSFGPPETYETGRAYELSWKPRDGIAFG
jgi:spermidine/putrescine transport system ATP-binding protein